MFSIVSKGDSNAFLTVMSISAITNMLSYLPQPVGSIANVAGSLFGSGGASSAPSTSPTSSSTPATTTQLSSVGSLINQLQQLQQNNPAKFSKITAAISTKLQKTAGQLQANGDTALATKLNALAQQFQTASQTGQMPSLSNLQAALTGGASSQGLGLAAAYQASAQSSMNVLSALSSSAPSLI